MTAHRGHPEDGLHHVADAVLVLRVADGEVSGDGHAVHPAFDRPEEILRGLLVERLGLRTLQVVLPRYPDVEVGRIGGFVVASYAD